MSTTTASRREAYVGTVLVTVSSNAAAVPEDIAAG